MQRKPKTEPDDNKTASGVQKSPVAGGNTENSGEKGIQLGNRRPDDAAAEPEPVHQTGQKVVGVTTQQGSTPHSQSSKVIDKKDADRKGDNTKIKQSSELDQKTALGQPEVNTTRRESPTRHPVEAAKPARSDQTGGYQHLSPNSQLRFLEDSQENSNQVPMTEHLMVRAAAAVDAARDSLAAAALAVEAAATAVHIALRASEAIQPSRTAYESNNEDSCSDVQHSDEEDEISSDSGDQREINRPNSLRFTSR